jgi:3-deoxy-D-manno-octulosonate 8-phosphate phosphatase (KDO 8-P phosphatase)
MDDGRVMPTRTRTAAQPPDARAARIKLLLLDVDGVLTDGKVLMHADGTESKRFDIKDGAALVWAQRVGLRVGLLSARPSVVTERRAAELRIRLLVQSHGPKVRAYQQILRRERLEDADIAYMGDDLLDLPVLARVGFSAAPADAVADVRTRVDFVAQAGGGNGAVRELVELLLRAQGLWEPFVAEWTSEAAP